jgi:ABC-type uncharacterized transport system involved in gliding motility auxiliary subunit
MMKRILSAIKDTAKRGGFATLTRGQKYGMSTAVAVVLVLAIVIFLEVLSYNHNTQFDLTTNKRFTVSGETANIMKSLSEPISAVAFVTQEQFKGSIEDLLKQYKYASGGNFKYRFVDPYLKPGEASSYKVTEDNTIVLVSGDKQERVVLTEADLLESGEQKITDAILKLLSTEPETIYFLTSHGERAINDDSKYGFSQAKGSLESQNYIVKTLDLTVTPDVPTDAAALIIAAPKKDLFDEEMKSITDYLNRAGTLMVMLDPGTATPKLTAFLSGIGIVTTDDVIVDRESRLFGADDLIPVANTYLKHPITRDINFISFFPYARSIGINEGTAEKSGWKLQSLIETGPNSWAERNIAALNQGKWELDKGTDQAGPVSVAVVGTKTIEPAGEGETTERPKEAKIAVFGSSAFVLNGYYLAALTKAANVDVFLNSVNWLAGNETLISIHPKEKAGSPILLTSSQGLLVFLVTVIVIPLLVAGAGTFVFMRRRLIQ